MTKFKNFIQRREPDFMETPPTRRDRVLTAFSYSFGCLGIALLLRGLFELWLRFHP